MNSVPAGFPALNPVSILRSPTIEILILCASRPVFFSIDKESTAYEVLSIKGIEIVLVLQKHSDVMMQHILAPKHHICVQEHTIIRVRTVILTRTYSLVGGE